MTNETGLSTTPTDEFPRETGLANVDMNASELDAFFEAQDENTRQGEARIHRLSICQPGSPEIQKDIPGYEKGMILDNKTRTILSTFGPPPWLQKSGVPSSEITAVHYLEIALIMKLPSEYVKWKTQAEQKASADGGRWHFRSVDVTEQRVREGIWVNQGGTWGKPGSGNEKVPPPVTENKNFMLLPIGPNGQPVANFMIGSFNRTSAGTGSLLVDHITALRVMKKVPWTSTLYLWMSKNTDGTNTWYEYNLCPYGRDLKALNPDAFGMCRAMGLQLADKVHGKTFQLATLSAADLDGPGGPVNEHGTEDGGIKQPGDPFQDDEEAPPAEEEFPA